MISTKLKIQIAMLMIANLVAGVFVGIYITSEFIGNFIPELTK